jgi:mono/diheme cytochrome c family protein
MSHRRQFVALFAALVVGASAAAAATQPSAASIDNGRRIFQTGRDVTGHKIAAQAPPMFSSCAACHGVNGAGGKKLPGGAVSADLRHAALVDAKPPYTIPLLERAIATGVDNAGKKLEPVMPHWKLSQRDLHDVATYIFTQLK